MQSPSVMLQLACLIYIGAQRPVLCHLVVPVRHAENALNFGVDKILAAAEIH